LIDWMRKKSLPLIATFWLAIHSCAPSGHELLDAADGEAKEYAVLVDNTFKLYIAKPLDVEARVCVSDTAIEQCDASQIKSLKMVGEVGAKKIHLVEGVTLKKKNFVRVIDADSKNLASFEILFSEPSGAANTTLNSGEYKGAGPAGSREARFSHERLSGTYRINAPEANSRDKAQGLLIYLHGDGAGDYSFFWNDLQVVAQKYDLIPVSVRTPDPSSVTWYRNGRGNATYLHQLIQTELYAMYNVNKDQIFFTGASGGPQFLTGQFVPLYGNHYRGGAVPMCGGGGPRGFSQTTRAFQPSADLIANFKIYYYTGTADFLYGQVRDSSQFYRSHGFETFEDFPQGVAHCKFNMRSALDKGLAKIVAR